MNNIKLISFPEEIPCNFDLFERYYLHEKIPKMCILCIRKIFLLRCSVPFDQKIWIFQQGFVAHLTAHCSHSFIAMRNKIV